MGYTHYFEIKKNSKGLSKKCLEDIKKVITKYKDIIQYENDNNEEPVVTKNLIRFNGIGEDGHETFYFQTPPKPEKWQEFKDNFLFQFCKTARKPYDIVVCEILLILKGELNKSLKLDSDGFSNSEQYFDGEWNTAIEEVKAIGYDIVGYVKQREGTPYYDCFIDKVKKKKVLCEVD